WMAWMRANSWKQVLWTGWLAQFVFNLIGFNWIAYTVHEFGHLPWPVAIVVLILYCGFANLYVPLVGLAWWTLQRKLHLSYWGRAWALVPLMMAGQRLFPMIFDWHTGYTWLWAGFPAFHLADMVGFVGLSDVGWHFNGILFQALLLYLYREGRSWIGWALSVPLVFGFLNLWGYRHGQHTPVSDQSLNFLIVQANIGNQEKLLAEGGGDFRTTVIQRFQQLSERGVVQNQNTDFIVWPETAFPEILPHRDMLTGYSFRLRQMITGLQTPLITGGYGRHEATGQITNSFFVLGKDGTWLAPPYHKTVLLAFGEYFPGATYFPILRSKFPEVGDFGRGPGPSVLQTDRVRLGAQICYEGLFDWFTRDLANNGAEVVVNLTNDSWYGTWMQPYQHLYMTLARAVEVRRPLVRSTNTGISTVILASGQILELSPLHEEWFHLYEVPYASNPPRTVFMGWGFWFFPALILLGLVLVVWKGREHNDQSGLG
ncbi:MAG: apolipoprotein N-acyltransferase, partial [Bdellovibrionales bacterium]